MKPRAPPRAALAIGAVGAARAPGGPFRAPCSGRGDPESAFRAGPRGGPVLCVGGNGKSHPEPGWARLVVGRGRLPPLRFVPQQGLCPTAGTLRCARMGPRSSVPLLRLPARAPPCGAAGSAPHRPASGVLREVTSVPTPWNFLACPSLGGSWGPPPEGPSGRLCTLAAARAWSSHSGGCRPDHSLRPTFAPVPRHRLLPPRRGPALGPARPWRLLLLPCHRGAAGACFPPLNTSGLGGPLPVPPHSFCSRVNSAPPQIHAHPEPRRVACCGNRSSTGVVG